VPTALTGPGILANEGPRSRSGPTTRVPSLWPRLTYPKRCRTARTGSLGVNGSLRVRTPGAVMDSPLLSVTCRIQTGWPILLVQEIGVSTLAHTALDCVPFFTPDNRVGVSDRAADVAQFAGAGAPGTGVPFLELCRGEGDSGYFDGTSVVWPPIFCQRPSRLSQISVNRRRPGT